MVATAINSVTMMLWKETAFPLCRAMERRWKRNVVSRVSSVIVVIRLPISTLCEFNGHLMPCTSCFYGKCIEDVCVCVCVCVIIIIFIVDHSGLARNRRATGIATSASKKHSSIRNDLAAVRWHICLLYTSPSPRD